MATVTGLTAERMIAIEESSVVDGEVIAGNLILSKFDGSQINAGSVIGPTGPQGPEGPPGPSEASGVTSTPTGDIAATNVQAALAEIASEKQAISAKGSANGYAPLDGSAKVPVANLPEMGAMVKLYDNILGAAGSWDVSGISQLYAHLRVILMMRSNDATGQAVTYLRFNNDSAGNYFYENVVTYADVVQPGEAAGAAQIFIGNVPAATAPAGACGISDIIIPNYTTTVFHKAMEAETTNRNGSGTTNMRRDEVGGHWASTSAINRLAIFPGAGQFIAGSRMTIYGIS